MRIHKHGLRSVAVLLSVLLMVYTLPLSAADGTSRATSIGQVSARGAVDLRGVRISDDGTLFSGDRMNVGSGAYATVALKAGPRIEADSGSDVTVTREADNIQVTMASGNVAFKGDGKTPVHVHVGAYEVTLPGNASGSVAYVGKNAFGVRVLTGSVSVRNTLTKKSFSVGKGSEQLISLQTGDVNQPIARLASSSVPSSIPALPQAGGQGSSGLSRGGWLAVLGTVAGASAAIIVLTTRDDDTDDDAATRLAQVKAISNLNAIAATATSISSAAATVTTTATAASAAINASNASNKAALLALANTTLSQASSATAKINALNPKVTSLQNQIASQKGAPTAAQTQQISQLLADLESARVDANNSITSLNSLLTQAQAAGVTGLPANPNVQPVQPPVIASASSPN